MKYILSLVFGFWSLVVSGQIANTQLSERFEIDTVKGCALAILDFEVQNPSGESWTRFQGVFLPVYRTRHETKAVQVNDPTGMVKAYITNYYQRDWTPLKKEDVALFIKRDWK